MTYEESIFQVCNFIRTECGDFRTACRFAAFMTLAISYGKDLDSVYTDASKIDDRHAQGVILTRKQEYQAANEARRQANIVSRNKGDQQ